MVEPLNAQSPTPTGLIISIAEKNSPVVDQQSVGPSDTNNSWLVYIILSSDQRLYTGITNNLPKRWKAHLNGKTGAKFFRGRSPEKLQYVETNHNRSSASKREAAIKKLSREKKLQLIASESSIDWHCHYGL